MHKAFLNKLSSKLLSILLSVLFLGGAITTGWAQADSAKGEKTEKAQETPRRLVSPADSVTENSVTIGGQKIEYRAVAGVIVVGGTDTYDTQIASDGQLLPDAVLNPSDPAKPEDAPARARMFYTAYFRKGPVSSARPLMFLFNGGPGSSTMWLHIGSFGPRRVVTPDGEHKAGAPYSIVDNPYCLLDVADLVFIDMPGAGFSRIQGKDKEKAFWGVDQDARAFARFIRKFLTKHDRWNSPKYLFGESYGTPRAAVLSGMLQGVDLNGIVLLSAILNFDNSADGPRANPSIDQPYVLALPTYAASAYYHHKLPTQPPSLEKFLQEVEQFATGEYMAALMAGSGLPEAKIREVAGKLNAFTGLPVDYILKANLRIQGGAFSKMLRDPEGITTGRLDTRFAGPDLNRLSEEAEYDPQASAISSAYMAAINDYLRTELKFGKEETYKPNTYEDIGDKWDFHHAPAGTPSGNQGFGSSTNTMLDLAFSLKTNPKLHVLLAGGYYDLATPYFEGVFEMRHMPIPRSLQRNITYKYYESGHMVYLNDEVARRFKADLAQFIRDTESGK